MSLRNIEWDVVSALILCLLAVGTGLYSRNCWKEKPVEKPIPSTLTLELPRGPFEYHWSTWYGPGKGMRNSDGTPFKGDKLTMASNVFMRKSILDLEFKGATVRVLTNDFGAITYDTRPNDPHSPYKVVHDVVDGKILRWTSVDCSKATAEALGFKKYGKARLKVYVVKCTGRYKGNRYDAERWDLKNVPKPKEIKK